MRRILLALLAILLPPASGQAIAPLVMRDAKTRPAWIATDDLADFDSLPELRRRLIEGALTLAKTSPWLPYLAGSADPAAGGFDCSGAMYFVLRLAGLKPPRSSRGIGMGP